MIEWSRQSKRTLGFWVEKIVLWVFIVLPNSHHELNCSNYTYSSMKYEELLNAEIVWCPIQPTSSSSGVHYCDKGKPKCFWCLHSHAVSTVSFIIYKRRSWALQNVHGERVREKEPKSTRVTRRGNASKGHSFAGCKGEREILFYSMNIWIYMSLMFLVYTRFRASRLFKLNYKMVFTFYLCLWSGILCDALYLPQTKENSSVNKHVS